ncbi:DUF378 domain-containing protein [Candidatus Dependentiae bacterium]|nr:DUF378 domain-containing protein [Candidatus Dependentiae bacterium]
MMKVLDWIAGLLAAIGAINWGLVAFLRFNLVSYIDRLVGNVGLDKIIYAIVALAGIYLLVSLFRS